MQQSSRVGTVRVALVTLGAVGLAAFVACQTPTSITFAFRTDVDCTATSPRPLAEVIVGEPSAVTKSQALREPTSTKECSTKSSGSLGDLGTLVVLPTENEGADIGMVAVLGVNRSTQSCGVTPDDDGDVWGGCIVARRRLPFLEGESVQVDVPLYIDCVGVPCDDFSTCVPARGCVSSEVDPSACVDGPCSDEGLGSGSASSGAVTGASSSDASSGEAASTSDASASTATATGASTGGGDGGAAATTNGAGGEGATSQGGGGSDPSATTGGGGDGGSGASGPVTTSGVGGDGGGSGASGPGTTSGAGGDGGDSGAGASSAASTSGGGGEGAGTGAGAGSSTGAGSLADGEECTADGDCANGFCEQGVCCNESCDGCRACRFDYTNVADGTCALVVPGLDPNGGCGGACATCDGTDICAAPNCFCVGNSDCVLCNTDGRYRGGTCEIADGTCSFGINPLICPGDYRCMDSACRTDCQNNYECRDGFVCNGGQCDPI